MMTSYDLWKMWEDDAGLEAELNALLQPVEPRPDFVRGLHGRLVKGEVPPALESNLLRNLIYAVVGVVSSVVIVITGVKATRSFLEQRRHMRAQSQQELAI